jgi:hypothetical protein
MSAGSAGRRWQVAGLAAVAAAAIAGCGASSGSTASASGAAASPGSAAASPASALSVVQLAAKTASGASSVTGTMSVQATVKPGATAPATGSTGSGSLALTATFAEQLRPSLLASVDITSLTSSGTSLPGGMSEVLTPSTLYLKASALTQQLHLAKPWIAIPLSQIGKNTGIDISQIFNSVNGNGPLTQSQLLAGATSVHQVGTSTTLDGVPVTEYTGTLSLDKGLANLPSSTKTQLQQAIASEGLTTANFTVWIDDSHTVRKSVVTEDGKALTETIATTVTSLGKPVNITVPPASETAPLPSGTTS